MSDVPGFVCVFYCSCFFDSSPCPQLLVLQLDAQKKHEASFVRCFVSLWFFSHLWCFRHDLSRSLLCWFADTPFSKHRMNGGFWLCLRLHRLASRRTLRCGAASSRVFRVFRILAASLGCGLLTSSSRGLRLVLPHPHLVLSTLFRRKMGKVLRINT